MTLPCEIMIVDDTPSVLELLTDILTESGYSVRPIDNGTSALQSAISDPPSLILMDIRMPGMDGFEVCRRLKAQQKCHNIPILFISAVNALKERVEGLALGAVDFISKPFQREELLARIHTHLELHRLRRELEAQVEARTQELSKSEAKLRSLFSAMTDVIVVAGEQGSILDVAPTRASILSRMPQSFLKKTLQEIIPARQSDLLRDTISRALEKEETLAVDFSLPIGNDEVWFSATVSPLSADAAMIVARDITERKHAEKALRESEERYRSIIEDIEDGYYEVDLAGYMTFCNPSLTRILGYTQTELIGMNTRSFMDEQNARTVFITFNNVYRSGSPAKAFGWELIRKDGSTLFAEASVSIIRDPDGNHVGLRGIIRDITERKRMEDDMREMSLRDQLTGLYNRRGFITLAEQQIKSTNRAKRQMPLAFIDVDDMKWINDTLGHEKGDQALIDTSNIFRQTFRESDIVARIGGDEFAVLATDVTEMNPEILSSRLQQNIDSFNVNAQRHYKLSMSWGTAMYDPESPTSLDQLMSAADELMYAQKRTKTKKNSRE